MAASIRVDLFFGTAYGLAASALIWTQAFSPQPLDAPGLLLLALCPLAGAMQWRVRLLGKLSASYPLLLATLLLFGQGASVLAGLLCAVGANLTLPHPGRRRFLRHAAFDLSRAVLACSGAGVAYLALGGTAGVPGAWPAALWPLTGHALGYATIHVGLTRLALRVSSRRRIGFSFWRGLLRSLPAYAPGLALAEGLAWVYVRPELRLLFLACAMVLVSSSIYWSRRSQRRLSRLHRNKTAVIGRSVTAALERMVEARDERTRGHLRRVQRLCIEVGHELGLSSAELEALASAALLHDIGKIAVPEGILNKPGRLTEAEMERIKAHPVLGADILQAIPFPHPLAPIVRHHHERWDGRGYPAGLQGERIPLGSRILAAVDTYDALTTDRPYRQALAHDEAVTFLRRESRHMFDSDVVETLTHHLEGLERPPSEPPGVEADDDGDTVDEATEPSSGNLPLAQRELQTLYEISRATDYDVSLEEFLTLVAFKLSPLVPHQSFVVYFIEADEGVLRAAFALGKAMDKLRLMTIPLGERLSGWAAVQKRALIGQDHVTPLERDGSRSDLEDWTDDAEMRSFGSTLVAPMIAEDRCLGVITLYDHAGRGFTPEDRRLLVQVSGYAAQVVWRSGGRLSAGDASLTDPLTGVPNARFLWLESAHRIALPVEVSPGFGLLAFRMMGLEQISERLGNEAVDRLLCRIARRFAAHCQQSETLVRFGHDLFMVLTSAHLSGDLVERWHDLAQDVERPESDALEGIVYAVRLASAHAVYPDDGTTLDSLIETLDARMTITARGGRTVLPFRARRAANSAI